MSKRGGSFWADIKDGIVDYRNNKYYLEYIKDDDPKQEYDVTFRYESDWNKAIVIIERKDK